MLKDNKALLMVLFFVLFIGGCSSNEPNPPGTPVVKPEQARSVAQEVYGLTEVDEVNIRHLTEDELKLLNEEQSKLTPIYYVINGIVVSEQVTVYVSSNEIEHHFIIHQ